jgi:hypothetical protein
MRPAAVLLFLAAIGCAGSPATRSSAELESTASLAKSACAAHEIPLEAAVTEFKVLERVEPKPPPGPAPDVGYACVHATIDVTGRLVDIEVVNTNHALFAGAFVRALGHWRFQPATRDGVPVPTRALLGSAFKTDRPPWPGA